MVSFIFLKEFILMATKSTFQNLKILQIQLLSMLFPAQQHLLTLKMKAFWLSLHRLQSRLPKVNGSAQTTLKLIRLKS